MPTLSAADATYRQARADLDEHNRRLGGVQSRLVSLRAEIASDDEVREAERNLRIAYGREAAALAGKRVLREAADHVIESCIQPIAEEVRGRWKHLFTNNGLMFQAGRVDHKVSGRCGVRMGYAERRRTDVGQDCHPLDRHGYYDVRFRLLGSMSRLNTSTPSYVTRLLQLWQLPPAAVRRANSW